MPFVPGWSPHFAARAAARLDASGRFCTVAPPTTPLPPAWSLSRFRRSYYEQGQAGSCWVHAAKQLAEVMGGALNYTPFPVCRRLIGYEGKKLEGGGNPSDGGSPTDAIVTMTPSGVGMAHEDLCEYTDDARTLGQKPPAAVYADAAHSHVLAPVKVGTLDQAKRLIANGHPVANGIWWPEGPDGWDAPRTIMRGFSGGAMGHALLLIGFAAAGVIDAEPCIQLDNWHGLLYPPLTPAQAIKVPGYMPINDRATSDFWVTEAAYLEVCGQAMPEHVSATDFSGLVNGIVVPNPGSDFANAFVV